MQSSQDKPRTLHQALNRRGKSDSASDGPRRLSDYVTRRPKTLADVRRITSLLESAAAATNEATATGTGSGDGPPSPTKPACTADKPCGCKSCGGRKSPADFSLTDDGVHFQDRGGVATPAGSTIDGDENEDIGAHPSKNPAPVEPEDPESERRKKLCREFMSRIVQHHNQKPEPEGTAAHDAWKAEQKRLWNDFHLNCSHEGRTQDGTTSAGNRLTTDELEAYLNALGLEWEARGYPLPQKPYKESDEAKHKRLCKLLLEWIAFYEKHKPAEGSDYAARGLWKAEVDRLRAEHKRICLTPFLESGLDFVSALAALQTLVDYHSSESPYNVIAQVQRFLDWIVYAESRPAGSWASKTTCDQIYQMIQDIEAVLKEAESASSQVDQYVKKKLAELLHRLQILDIKHCQGGGAEIPQRVGAKEAEEDPQALQRRLKNAYYKRCQDMWANNPEPVWPGHNASEEEKDRYFTKRAAYEVQLKRIIALCERLFALMEGKNNLLWSFWSTWAKLYEGGKRLPVKPCVNGKRLAVLPSSDKDCDSPPVPTHAPCPPFTDSPATSWCDFMVDGKCYRAVRLWKFDRNTQEWWAPASDIAYFGPIPCDGLGPGSGVIAETTDCTPLSDEELVSRAGSVASSDPIAPWSGEPMMDAFGVLSAAWKSLPDCPCETPLNPDGTLQSNWCRENPGDYHKGAEFCYRTHYNRDSVTKWLRNLYVLNPLLWADGSIPKVGQQCCYDNKGKLITGGPGAGTPDIYTTSASQDSDETCGYEIHSVLQHLAADVYPWHRHGYLTYNKIWVPNTGKCCEVNIPGVR